MESTFETQNTLRRILATVLLAMVPVGLVGTIKLFLIRDSDLVKARLPKLSIAISIVLLVYVVFKGLSLVLDAAPCSGLGFITPFALHGFALTGYLIRAFVLWFRVELANDSILYWKHSNGHEQDDGKIHTYWFQRHRYLIRPLNLRIFFFVSISTFTTLAVLSGLEQMDEKLRADDAELCPYTVYEGITLILACIFGGCILLLAFKLRKGLDAFGIKAELQYTGWPCLFLLGIFIMMAITDTFNTPRMQGNSLTTTLGSLVPVFVSTWWVVWKENDYQRRNAKGNDGKRASIVQMESLGKTENVLMEMLGTEKGFEIFKDYLATEFAVENVLFWRDAGGLFEDLRVLLSSSSYTDIKAEAVRLRYIQIAKTYFDDEGPLPINVSGAVRKTSCSLAESLGSDCSQEMLENVQETLGQAQHQIFKTMYEDSWRRFKQSVHYEEWERIRQSDLESQMVMKELI